MPSWLNVLFLLLLLTPFSQELVESKLSPHHRHHYDDHNHEETRKEVITAEHGAVAADDSRCSKIGRDALLDGGSAVDATVATAVCLGVVSPASSGIGGGAFMVVRLANGTTQAFDFREIAPLKAFRVRILNLAHATC